MKRVLLKEKDFTQLSVEEVLSKLETQKTGLCATEAKKRLEQYGPNVISEKKKKSRLIIFLENFKSPLVYILFVAAVVTFLMKEYLDSAVIFGITLINAVIGYYQQNKTENALEALRKMTTLNSNVLRDGKPVVIKSDCLVVGDVVILEEGDKIPADGRIIESSELLINEAVLTGESLAVKKNSDIFEPVENSEEPRNLVFMGTTVLGGRGLMVITAVGKKTEFGKISQLVEDEIDSLTPLQRKLATFSKKLGALIISICAFIFAVGIITGKEVIVMLELSISMAVSAIPEGLPVAITVILVLGIKRMAKHKAILRNLTAVETLGTTTVIASDKTGTLTHNKLTVTKIYTDKIYRVSGEGYGSRGEIFDDQLRYEPDEHIRQLLKTGAIVNNGRLVLRGNRTDVFGDPTDCAILVAARKVGIELDALQKYIVRMDEIPFSSETKYHAVLAESSGTRAIYIKGAFEEIIRICSSTYRGEAAPKKITSKDLENINAQAEYFASRGLRVIALAYREESLKKIHLKEEDIKKGNFVFVGLVGMRDTYRSGVKEAIETCHDAGIRMIMITGDHLETARAIGYDIGILKSEAQAVEASKLESMPQNMVRKIVEKTTVFARISPISKYKIIEALKKNGEIVAMTGDGVNDVPALKKADIGVAMGVMGTEAAKDASDMVLTDDNFSTLVHAVSEGRAAFSNIRKTLFYLLSTNLGEVLTVLSGLILGYPLVLLPLQILWINLVTDSFTAIPLGMEPPHTNQIKRPPRDPKESIISKRMVFKMIIVAVIMAAGSIYIFQNTIQGGIVYARTMVFAFLVLIQWLNVINARSETSSIFTVKPFSNKPLVWGLLVAIVLQMAALYTSFVEKVFDLVPLSVSDWVFIVPIALLTVVASEVEKLVYRARLKKD